MKTLILYTTKHGATKKIAEMIKQQLPDTALCNLKQDTVPPLSDYDCVVLGSSLMAGQISKELKTFAEKNSPVLQEMVLGLFVSGLDASQEAQYLETNFPVELHTAAKAKRFLGGIYDPAACGFLERTLMKAVAKQSAYTWAIESDKIDLFVKELTT